MNNQLSNEVNYSDITAIEMHLNTYKKYLGLPNATALDISLFAQFCQKTKLDPLTRQIYMLPFKDKNQVFISIDGQRIIAQRTGEYDGSETLWCGEDGEWKDVWIFKTPPAASKVIVYKKGSQRGISAVALYSEYAGNSPTWKKMPALMLAKCAESLALRKAFPANLSGLYTSEEMEKTFREENHDNVINVNSDSTYNAYKDVYEHKIENADYIKEYVNDVKGNACAGDEITFEYKDRQIFGKILEDEYIKENDNVIHYFTIEDLKGNKKKILAREVYQKYTLAKAFNEDERLYRLNVKYTKKNS